MPMNPAVVIGAGAVLLLALAGGKKKKNGKGPVGGSCASLGPAVHAEKKAQGFVCNFDTGEWEPSGEPAPTPQNEQVLAVLDDYVLPVGYEFPQDISTEEWPTTLWLSEDCKAYAVGKEFGDTLTPQIVEFYNSIVDTVAQDDPELASSPPDHWDEIMFDAGADPFESPTKRWGMQYLFDFGGGVYELCASKLPVIQDYDSWEDYLAAFVAFKDAEPALYRLFFKHLYAPAKEIMEAEWKARFPEQATYWHEREWAIQAVDQNLNLEDRTDWAFHHAYPEGPEVLDPNNAAHQQYIAAWLRLRDMIKEMS